MGSGREILAVRGVRKRFGATVAVDGVSFTAARGEILGIIGANGAGKSTLVHMLPDLITPDAGEIVIFGETVRRRRDAILSRINIVSPYACLPGRLTVRENLAVYAGIYGVRRPGRRIAALLEEMEVAGLANVPVARLSSGQATRVGLCKALINEPELLLLDEPTAYLDLDAAIRTRALLARHCAERGMTILWTSHDLHEIEQMCDRIVLLRRGVVAASGTVAEITGAMLGDREGSATLREVFLHAAQPPRETA